MGTDDDRIPVPDQGPILLALYDRALPEVFGYLLPRCGSTSVAEDLTSETFVAAVTAVRERKVPRLTTAWLVGVARHKLVDHWRREERESRRLQAVANETVVVDDPWDAGLHLEVPDVDDVHARAVAAGATTLREPEDQFHGNRNAVVRDPFGHRWVLSTPVEQLGTQEMAGRARGHGFETTTGAPTTPIGELGYWTFRVPDVDRAADFYGALLGWSFEPAEGGEARVEHRYRHVSNTSVPMGVHDDMESAPQTLYFRVDDLDATTARVRELGGEVLDVTDHASGGNARCRDDQGVEFELWKPAPGYE